MIAFSPVAGAPPGTLECRIVDHLDREPGFNRRRWSPSWPFPLADHLVSCGCKRAPTYRNGPAPMEGSRGMAKGIGRSGDTH
jgi:hypothetical protein